MLQVHDVGVSSAWYQAALGLSSGHGGDEYEMLFDGDDFVLQLHRIDAHEHGFAEPDAEAAGAGVSLWFEADDRVTFAALVERARTAGATIVAEPSWNPLAHHYEATLTDPDGYVVVLNSPFEPDPG
jgi:catechol 2,3-dioxygenase-like lactoylglutathione lyase family enzyme